MDKKGNNMVISNYPRLNKDKGYFIKIIRRDSSLFCYGYLKKKLLDLEDLINKEEVLNGIIFFD